jgi:DNA-binding XRE family transcriptional regulator
MEHEDKSPAPLTPPDEVGRPRVVSAAAVGGGGGAPTSDDGDPSGHEDASADEPDAPENRKRHGKGPNSHPNNVRRLRIERMMSKAELARRANVSVLTIDRVEKGYGCRMDTKRKILEALGLSLGDRVQVFGDDD